MKFNVEAGLRTLQLKNFEICTLEIDSKILASNPLGDSALKRSVMLIPKKKPPKLKQFPVVLILAGFTGNGPNYFGHRPFENNFPETIDSEFEKGLAPSALYVFVDAFTGLGGSQFLDSSAVGNYERYLINEVVASIHTDPDVSSDPEDWCVMGGSSGGYGALHLLSQYSDIFGLAGAVAPDAHFESVYLPDLYANASAVSKFKKTSDVVDWVKDGGLNKRNGHQILNAYAMSACYSPKGSVGIEYPIDFDSGELLEKVWKKWKEKDPTIFLKQRKFRSQGVFLEVGKYDEHCLYFGSRQIKKILESKKIKTEYLEFDGGHRDLSSSRPRFLKWLKSRLNT
jgi:enterochelin esterase family protein